MMYGIGIILCFQQKSRMWNVAVTFLASEVEMITNIKPNCRLIGEHSQNSPTAGITYPVT